jgi:hypothetical protein
MTPEETVEHLLQQDLHWTAEESGYRYTAYVGQAQVWIKWYTILFMSYYTLSGKMGPYKEVGILTAEESNVNEKEWPRYKLLRRLWEKVSLYTLSLKSAEDTRARAALMEELENPTPSVIEVPGD